MKKSILAVAMMLSLVACSDDSKGDDNGKSEPINISLTADENACVEASNALAFKMFEQLNNDGTENVAFSPLSLNMALAMAANGASGNTLQQMQDVLSGGVSLDALNSLSAKLLRDLPLTDADAVVKLANSLWSSNSFSIKDSYKELLADKYAAASTTYAPDDKAGTAQAVNDWIRKATDGFVGDLVTEEDVTGGYMLVNAACFKADWKHKFKKDKTKQEPFLCADGSYATANMMHGSMSSGVVAMGTEVMKFAGMPFGNEAYYMFVVLPEEGRTVSEAMSDASRCDFFRFGCSVLNISMPRFTMSATINMVSGLKALGMTDAFDPAAARFEALSDELTYISTAKQGCSVSVDEDGAEAGASTNISGAVSSVGPGFSMVLDRPFGFFIVEKSTGIILFMGAVNTL